MAPQNKEIPYCTIFLVTAAVVSNVCVLIGNLETSASFVDMGSSTHGWSNVGQGMAKSFDQELDTLMNAVTIKLTAAVGDIARVTNELDTMLMLIGKKADASMMEVAKKSAHVAVGQHVNSTKPYLGQLPPSANPYEEVKAAAMADISKFIEGEVGKVNELLQDMIVAATPALLQIGKWEISFGTKLQQDISQFGTTIDWVEKVFDEIMAKLKGTNMTYQPYMLYNTFNLLDPEANDCITLSSLQGAATMYGITAISGIKGEEVFEKYSGADGCVDHQEYAQLVTDPGLNGILGTILRTYAEDLAEVGGTVGQARLRDEVADATVSYLQLVSAKNHTKVGWIAERLTNGSVPMAFTACVLRELALESTDPNVLSTINVGALVIDYLIYQNAAYTIESFKMMSQPGFWISEGFLPDGIGAVVNIVGGWIQTALNETANGTNPAQLSLLEGAGAASVEKLVRKMSADADAEVKKINVQAHEDQVSRRVQLFESASSRHLFDIFLGGKTVNAGNFLDGLSPTEWETLHSGVPAVPATLQFAKFLSWNCSRDADTYLHNVFGYTSTSSNQLDAFANDIQSFVVKVQSFLTTIETYSGAKGIAFLESEFMSFVDGAEAALLQAIDPIISKVISTVIDKVAQMGLPLDPDKILREVEEDIQDMISGGKKLLLLGEQDVSKGVQSAKACDSSSSSGANSIGSASMVIFEDIRTLLADLMALLPSAVTTIKDARSEVCTVAQTMTSIFNVFAVKGPAIFNDVAEAYKILWIVYFVLLIPLTIGILWYGMWASGWMGGPQASKENPDAPPPQTFSEQMASCCNACLGCCSKAHDSTLCFWSCIIIFQIIVLVIFIVAIVLSLLAGVKAFISDACEQVYMLNESGMCLNVLNSVKGFIPSFIVDPLIALEDTCDKKKLLLCELIGKKMINSVILTTVFSFLSAIFQYQLVIESARLHERAVGRRTISELTEDKMDY